MNLCPVCRKLVFRTDPCKGNGVACGRTDGGAKKSTALLKEASAGSVRGKAGREKVAQPEPVRASQAGTQALPVDTNNQMGPITEPDGLGRGEAVVSDAASNPSSGRARAVKVPLPSAEGAIPSPGAKFDKAAWMRANMPKYMRDYRAAVKAGIRAPKPRDGK